MRKVYEWGVLITIMGLAACVPPRPREASMVCQVGSGNHSDVLVLTPSECVAAHARRQAAREAQNQEAERTAAVYRRQHDIQRVAAEKTYQETVAANVANAKAKGYDLMAFRDFQVDAAKLAERHAKVVVEGRFLSLSEGGYLVESLVSIAIMRRTGQINQGIPLLTDNAPRGLRAYLVDCTSNAVGSQLGCPIAVFGTTRTCAVTIFAGRRMIPCIEVQGGWYVSRPSN